VREPSREGLGPAGVEEAIVLGTCEAEAAHGEHTSPWARRPGRGQAPLRGGGLQQQAWRRPGAASHSGGTAARRRSLDARGMPSAPSPGERGI